MMAVNRLSFQLSRNDQNLVPA